MARSHGLRSLDEALGRAAAELGDMAQTSERLQAVIAELMARTGPKSVGLIADCQLADLLSQRLVGLAVFVTALAAVAPQNVPIDALDALQDVTLSGQARRLLGLGAAAEADDQAGELALFVA